jgi:hypothetical protein
MGLSTVPSSNKMCGAQQEAQITNELKNAQSLIKKSLPIIEAKNSSVEDKFNAYQQLSDYINHTGSFSALDSNIDINQQATLKADLKDCLTQLNEIAMPVSNGAAVVILNGVPANAWQILTNWNNPKAIFGVVWNAKVDSSKGQGDDYDGVISNLEKNLNKDKTLTFKSTSTDKPHCNKPDTSSITISNKQGTLGTLNISAHKNHNACGNLTSFSGLASGDAKVMGSLSSASSFDHNFNPNSCFKNMQSFENDANI